MPDHEDPEAGRASQVTPHPHVRAPFDLDVIDAGLRVAQASGGDLGSVMTLAMGEAVRSLFPTTPEMAERRRVRAESMRVFREEERRRREDLARAARAASGERRAGKMARRAAAAGHVTTATVRSLVPGHEGRGDASGEGHPPVRPG